MVDDGAGGNRGLSRPLMLVLGVAAVLAVAGLLAGLRSMAALAAPEEISNAELLSRVARAPESAADFGATLTVEQSLVPAGLLEAAGGEGGVAASGPQSARVWYGGPDRFRAELQGENSDKVFVQNGEKVWAYDGATNTLKTGDRPRESRASEPQEETPPSPADVDRMLAELAPTSELSQGTPVRYAGREAYVLTISPKDEASTLVERGRALIDSETYLPLQLSLYAESSPDPVFSWSVSGLDVGPVPAERFDFQTPPGAKVVPLDEGEDRRHQEGDAGTKPREVETMAEAQRLVGFEILELTDPPGGRELTGVYLKGSDGVVLAYGSGWGTVVLAQAPGQTGATVPQAGAAESDLALPKVDLGGGVEATELSTPVGSALRWSAGGVSYVLAGSVPAGELERAARELR